jgi:hypothetical protein
VIKRLLKWAGIGLGGIIAIVLVADAYVWLASGVILEREYPLPETAFVADPALADLEEGRRLAV